MLKSITTILFLFFILSCKDKNQTVERKSSTDIVYTKDTKDVLFYENKDIADTSARRIFNEGLERVETRDYETAMEKFIEADKIEKSNPIILAAIAQAEFELGNEEASINTYFHILSIDSTYVAAYVNLGQNYMHRREYQKAKAILLKGLKHSSGSSLHFKSILFLNLAVSCNNCGDCSKGLEYAVKALEISQDEKLSTTAAKVKWESENNCEQK